MAVQNRGVAQFQFTGGRALECLSDYEVTLLLREFDAQGVDVGARNLSPFDTNSVPGSLVTGNGFRAYLYDRPGGTLLATGTALLSGSRSSNTAEFLFSPLDGGTVTITSPIRADETVPLATFTQIYTWKTIPAAPGDLQAGLSARDSLDVLIAAINGTSDYGDPTVFTGTSPMPELFASHAVSPNQVLLLEARDGGMWGNSVAAGSSVGANVVWDPPAGSDSNLSGGTGNSGLNVRFAAADLPNSLILPGSLTRIVHIEVFGHDSANSPTKLATGPAQLYASDAPAIP